MPNIDRVFINKKAIYIIIALMVVFYIAGYIKDLSIKIAVERGVEAATGLKLDIKSLKASLITSAVDIKGLRLYNGPAYPDRVMMDMPEIYVAYDLPAIMRGDMHLKNVRLSMKEFYAVKNKNRELNINMLRVVKDQRAGVKSASGGPGGPPRVRIDKLRLKIGKVLYKDYSAGEKPRIKEYNIYIDEEYSNIKDAYSLISLIVIRSLSRSSESNFAGFDINGLKSSIAGTFGKFTDFASKTVEGTADTVKKTDGAVGGSAAGAPQNAFKNSLGSK